MLDQLAVTGVESQQAIAEVEPMQVSIGSSLAEELFGFAGKVIIDKPNLTKGPDGIDCVLLNGCVYEPKCLRLKSCAGGHR